MYMYILCISCIYTYDILSTILPLSLSAGAVLIHISIIMLPDATEQNAGMYVVVA